MVFEGIRHLHRLRLRHRLSLKKEKLQVNFATTYNFLTLLVQIMLRMCHRHQWTWYLQRGKAKTIMLAMSYKSRFKIQALYWIMMGKLSGERAYTVQSFGRRVQYIWIILNWITVVIIVWMFIRRSISNSSSSSSSHSNSRDSLLEWNAVHRFQTLPRS